MLHVVGDIVEQRFKKRADLHFANGGCCNRDCFGEQALFGLGDESIGAGAWIADAGAIGCNGDHDFHSLPKISTSIDVRVRTLKSPGERDLRSEERRVGKEWVGTGRTRW